MRAWMRGETPFPASKEARSRPEGSKTRFYGVYRTKNGLRSFVVREEKSIPKTAVEIFQTEGPANALAREILQRHETQEVVVPSARPLDWMTGRIGHHADGGPVHTAICVGVDLGDCLLLFMTSHPNWNPYSRPLRKDEAPFTGFSWNSMTFLAPVLRAGDSVSWTDRQIPDHRVESLRAEFFRPEWLSHIYRL